MMRGAFSSTAALKASIRQGIADMPTRREETPPMPFLRLAYTVQETSLRGTYPVRIVEYYRDREALIARLCAMDWAVSLPTIVAR